jgi:hypothetical protein
LCRKCPSSFDRPHQLLAHYWQSHIKQDILSSFTDIERARFQDLAEAFIYVTALVDHLIERSTAIPDVISGVPSDPIGALSTAFHGWANVASLVASDQPHIPALENIFNTVDPIIASVTKKTIPGGLKLNHSCVYRG